MKTEENKSIKNGFDRQVMEEVPAEEYNLLRTLIDNMPDYIFVKDTQSHFLLSNKAHVRALGTSSQEELWGKTDFDIFPQELAAQYYADEQQVIQSGQALIDREELYVDPTGNWRWLSTTKVPLRDNEGNIIGLVGISRDITERKQMEETLAEERNMLRTLIDNIPDYVFVKNTKHEFMINNLAHLGVLGAVAQQEAVGKTNFDYLPEETATHYYAEEEKVLKTGEPIINDEEIIIDQYGHPKWHAITKLPLRDNQDNIVGLVGISRNITKQKQTEELLRQAHDELEMRVLQRTVELAEANKVLQAEIVERKQAEQAMRESEERLRRVVENMPVMMNAFDNDGNIIVWNRECERVTGYSAEEIVDNPQAMELLYPDDNYRRKMVTEWNERDNDYRNWEWEITGKVSSPKTIAWSNISQQFPIPGWAAWGIGVDVTERRRVDEALRQSEQRYKQLLSSVTDYIYTVHIEYDQVVGTTHSPNCIAVTGYTTEEYNANPNLWYQMIYEEDRSAVIEQATTLLKGQTVSPLEHRIIRKDGSVRWVKNTPVLRKDEHSHVVSYDGLITDITARKLAEEALRRSERRYRLLMEHASDGIFILDQYGTLLQVNSKVSEMLGYSRAELLTFKIEDLIPPEDLATTPLAYDELWAGNTVLRERYLRRCDDSFIPVEISAKVIERDRILGILRDISERKAVEQRERLAYNLGRQLTTLLDQDALLAETVNRIKETFGYYHVHVYLVEGPFPEPGGSRERLLVVHEGTGEAGQALKEQTHAIPLNTERSLVARSARSVEPVVANDVSQNPDHLPNLFLPKTRSEVAIPLFLGSRLIGVLDVQHTTINRFTPDEVRTLQIIASQLSVALANAALFAENAGRSAIIENSSDLIALFNLDDGFIIDINPAGVKLLGFSQPEHVIYIPLSSFYSPEGLHRVEDEGIPTALRQGVWRGENLICQVDGTCIPVSQTIFVIHNKQGEPTVLATIMSDITKRKQAEEEQQRLFEEVKAGRERLQLLSHRLVEVQEAERRHIARELHDEVGQLLTGLKLTLEMTANLPNELAASNLSEAQTLVNELIAQVRELSLELRPAMLDDLGLLPTLLWHFDRYSNQTNIQVNFKHTGLEQRFATAVETAAYRIVQEALTNAARYAGVDQITVHLWVDNEEALNLQVEDQGAGFDLEAAQTAGDSSGLSGMYERAVLLSGQVNVKSAPGHGTLVTARLPLNILTEPNF